MDGSIRTLEEYIKKNKQRQNAVASNSSDNASSNRITKTRKQKWEEKQTSKLQYCSDRPKYWEES